MKTKEFIKRVEELGFKVFNESDYYVIKDEYEDNVANVNKTTLTQMSTDYIEWDEVYDEVYDGDKTKLFNLLVEYARTPIEDREEEKKFYLKHRYFEIAGGGRGFFTIDNDSGLPFLSYKTSSDNYNQIFTFKEIEEIKEKFDTDLKDFELVKVEE